MSDWQPIEGAPKDGSVILLYVPMYDFPKMGSWREDENMGHLGEMWLDESFDDFSCGFASVPIQPTHWMPLPSPPQSNETNT